MLLCLPLIPHVYPFVTFCNTSGGVFQWKSTKRPVTRCFPLNMFDSKQEYLKREWRECLGLSKTPLEKRAITQGTVLILDTFLKTGGASKIYSRTWGCHWHWLWNLWHSVYRTNLEVSIHHGMFFYVSCLFHLIISFPTPFAPLRKQTYSKLMVGSDEHFL